VQEAAAGTRVLSGGQRARGRSCAAARRCSSRRTSYPSGLITAGSRPRRPVPPERLRGVTRGVAGSPSARQLSGTSPAPAGQHAAAGRAVPSKTIPQIAVLPRAVQHRGTRGGPSPAAGPTANPRQKRRCCCLCLAAKTKNSKQILNPALCLQPGFARRPLFSGGLCLVAGGAAAATPARRLPAEVARACQRAEGSLIFCKVQDHAPERLLSDRQRSGERRSRERAAVAPSAESQQLRCAGRGTGAAPRPIPLGGSFCSSAAGPTAPATAPSSSRLRACVFAFTARCELQVRRHR